MCLGSVACPGPVSHLSLVPVLDPVLHSTVTSARHTCACMDSVLRAALQTSPIHQCRLLLSPPSQALWVKPGQQRAMPTLPHGGGPARWSTSASTHQRHRRGPVCSLPMPACMWVCIWKAHAYVHTSYVCMWMRRQQSCSGDTCTHVNMHTCTHVHMQTCGRGPCSGAANRHGLHAGTASE